MKQYRAKCVTPLTTYLRDATPEEREETARLAGTSVNYLYALAGCHRKNPAVHLAIGIENATRQMSIRTEGRLPIVEASVLATMCAASVF